MLVNFDAGRARTAATVLTDFARGLSSRTSSLPQEDTLRQLAAEFERREGVAVELNLAGSNTLAQQILAAPGADVFLSADRPWVEVLEDAGRVVAGSRRPLLGNRLVLIASAEALERMSALGLANAVFPPLANRPESGDFLSGMRDGLDSLRRALADATAG